MKGCNRKCDVRVKIKNKKQRKFRTKVMNTSIDLHTLAKFEINVTVMMKIIDTS